MKCMVNRDQLLESLVLACKVISKKSAFPIMTSLKITACHKGLEIQATDLDSIAICMVNILGDWDAGATTVKAKECLALVKSIDRGSYIQLESSQDGLVVSTDSLSSTLPTLPLEDYPEPIEKGDFIYKIEISGHTLKGLLSSAKEAMADRDVRFYLNGMLLELDHDRQELALVATDGARLSSSRVSFYIEKGMQLIIPRKSILLIDSMLTSKKDCLVELRIFKNAILIKKGDYCLLSKLIDGKYPEYRRVIPEQQTGHWEFKTKDLLSVLKRLLSLDSSKFPIVRIGSIGGKATISALRLSTEKSIKTGITSKKTDGNLGKESLPCEWKGSPEVLPVIDLNTNYLIDVLKTIHSPTVSIGYKSSADSILLEDGEAIHVIMPCRT